MTQVIDLASVREHRAKAAPYDSQLSEQAVATLSNTVRVRHPRTIERIAVRSLCEDPTKLTVDNLMTHHGRIQARALNRALSRITTGCGWAVEACNPEVTLNPAFAERYFEINSEALTYLAQCEKILRLGRMALDERLPALVRP